MAKGTRGFKNIKLGKNVYRQLKRKGPPAPPPGKTQKADPFSRPEDRPKK